jgi:hypothetical protein
LFPFEQKTLARKVHLPRGGCHAENSPGDGVLKERPYHPTLPQSPRADNDLYQHVGHPNAQRAAVASMKLDLSPRDHVSTIHLEPETGF